MDPAIPFFILTMVEYAFGYESRLEFIPIPRAQRPRWKGHRCVAQVQVRVGPAPADFNYHFATGESCLAALKTLLNRAPSHLRVAGA